MTGLLVLYDGHCPFCCAVRDYLAKQPQLAPIAFHNCWDPPVRAKFGDYPIGSKLVVVDGRGGVYWGTGAYLAVLWALTHYRDLALTLAEPWLRPFSNIAFALLSDCRVLLGWIWGVPTCDDNQCNLPRANNATQHGMPYRASPRTGRTL